MDHRIGALPVMAHARQEVDEMVGLAGALVLKRAVSSLVFGVSESDPLTFLSVSALLAMVALVAGILPAYRATKVDPMRALREE